MENAQSEEEYSVIGSDLEDDVTWIDWFCNVKGNEFYTEVDQDYIRDSFNLTGLNTVVKHFNRALDIILDDDDDEEDDINDPEGGDSDSTMTAAQTLYGLIHARYILTHRGLAAMLENYNSSIYGLCPNLYCHNQAVAPVGMSDRLGYSTTYVFCARCNEIYEPESSRLASIDGAFFGTTFPHMFFLQYEHLVPTQPAPFYVPRIYGFNVWRGLKDMLRTEYTVSSSKQLAILRNDNTRQSELTNKTRTDTREDALMMVNSWSRSLK